jgi:hypothetical protein
MRRHVSWQKENRGAVTDIDALAAKVSYPECQDTITGLKAMTTNPAMTKDFDAEKQMYVCPNCRQPLRIAFPSNGTGYYFLPVKVAVMYKGNDV